MKRIEIETLAFGLHETGTKPVNLLAFMPIQRRLIAYSFVWPILANQKIRFFPR